MILSQYYAFCCNQCSGRYYVDAGDPNDLTVFVRCPWCGAVERLSEEGGFEPDDGDGDGYADVGEKSLPEFPPQKAKSKKAKSQ
jgi:endogenous inhibitor of DNA gyrase (YacG/DUF329 family)